MEVEVAPAPTESSNGIVYENEKPSTQMWGDLQRQLPHAAKMLNVEESKIRIYAISVASRDYMISKHRDLAVDFCGPYGSLPFIQTNRKHNGVTNQESLGYGLIKFKARDSDLEYVTFVERGTYGDLQFLILREGDVFKYCRHCQRQNKIANPITDAPILENGVLEDVLINTIGFLSRAKEIEKYNVKIKRGIILNGEPGNGKTMICRYIQKICDQKNINWGIITSAAIDRAYNDQRLNELFDQYTVSFFDDIDVAYMDRSRGNGKMACSMLTAMDGVISNKHVVRIFTTNESINEMDKAFVRPGRIDRFIAIKKPNSNLRRRFVMTWDEEILSNINVDDVVQKSENYSFAELEAIKTNLVTQFVFYGEWDQEKAFEEFDERKQIDDGIKGKTAGFGSDNVEVKSRRLNPKFDFEKFKKEIGI